MKSMIALLTILINFSSFAGAANATLNCASDSGRTLLNGTVPVDYEEHNLELTIDDETVQWYSEVNQTTYETEENSKAFVLGSLKEKNYHFLITGTEGYRALTFTAVPSSIKLEQTQYGEKATFKAVLFGRDPRADRSFTPKITVNCNYTYEI